jgi:acetyltransferase-like isoleucine patch superfamily enzyme
MRAIIDMIESLLIRDPTALAYKRMRRKTERCRLMGAQIGEFVRLWGNVDFANPHLVTIGDCICIGGEHT